MLNTVFFGTPAVAVPFLERTAARSRLLGVVTSPDRPVGRGYAVTPPPVKVAAQKLGAPVLQPASLRKEPVLDALRAWGAADLAVVVAYGKLIPREIFTHPRHGAMNVHFSLLPKYRGAGPVQWALIRGETMTGVSLFRLEETMDTGPVYLKAEVPVDPADNAVTLREKLAARGVGLLEEALDRFERGGFVPFPQAGEPSFAPMLKKEDGRLRWAEQTAGEAANLVRGACEWPGATTALRGQTLKMCAAEPAPGEKGVPGEITAVERGKGFLVKCREGALRILRVQPEGKKEMDAASFWNGARLSVGDRFDA